jgi:hypothetical protein
MKNDTFYILWYGILSYLYMDLMEFEINTIQCVAWRRPQRVNFVTLNIDNNDIYQNNELMVKKLATLTDCSERETNLPNKNKEKQFEQPLNP